MFKRLSTSAGLQSQFSFQGVRNCLGTAFLAACVAALMIMTDQKIAAMFSAGVAAGAALLPLLYGIKPMRWELPSHDYMTTLTSENIAQARARDDKLF